MAGYQLPTDDDVSVADEIGLYVPGSTQHVEKFLVAHGYASVIVGSAFSQLVLVIVDTSHRRQGVANHLLDRVHEWADQHHRHLWLTPTQLVDDGPTEETLAAWYQRRGWSPFDINGESALARTWTPEPTGEPT